MESKDVVAGEQNIERQSVFLKDVSAPRFLSEDKASPPHFHPPTTIPLQPPRKGSYRRGVF